VTDFADSRHIEPLLVTIPRWIEISGMRRTSVYEALAKGHIAAKKRGRSTLIVYKSGLAFIAQLPAAAFRAPPR
jgi:hypothetical protein